MADAFKVSFETKEVQSLLRRVLKRVEDPKRLLRLMERYVHAMTMKMFRGTRPDTTAVRGVKWAPLAKSTIRAKAAAKKRGRGIAVHRPLVMRGDLRDSLKTLSRGLKGFVYGTQRKSDRGYPYPGIHQVGGKNFPARKWLFLSARDWRQLVKMTVDHLEGEKRSLRSYAGKG